MAGARETRLENQKERRSEQDCNIKIAKGTEALEGV